MHASHRPRLLSLLVLATLAAAALALTGCDSAAAFSGKSGGLAMLVAAFLGGMAVCLTPCVYPLIPITVSVFGGMGGSEEAPGKRRLRAVISGVMYVLGIAVTYSSLGLIAGLAGRQAVGDHLGAWYVVVPLAVLFLAMAASMFGAFELALPSSLQSRLSGVGGSGVLGGFLMGLVAGLLAAPCTGPVITGILAYIASSQDAFMGFWLLFTFSMGMGLMFFLIAAFASVMPRSGNWMEGVKSVFGVLMIVAALYYLSGLVPVLSSVRVRALWVVLTGGGLIVLGAAVGGVHLSFHDPRTTTWVRKIAGILALTAGIFLVLQWARGSDVKLQYSSIPRALAAAKESRRPVLMDFWATWCESCIELEKETLAHPKVAAELKQRFITVKVDCSKKNDAVKRLKADWGVKDLPTLVLVSPDGQRIRNLVGKVSPSELLEALGAVR